MIILAVNNSNSKSILRAKKILSKYLFQVSNSTFIGKVSISTYEKIVEELKGKSLKSLSVQIYKFYKKRYEMCYNIGNLNDISNGVYCFKTSNIIKDKFFMLKLNNSLQLLKEITILSGLFHDLGKNTVKFQNKLKNTENSSKVDFVRHEVISYLIVKNIKDQIIDFFKNENKSFKNKDLNNNIFFDFLSNMENIKSIFQNIKLDYSNVGDIIGEMSISENNFKNHQTIINYVSWLVLTHHKLSDDLKKEFNFEIFENINIKNLLNDYLKEQDNYNQEDYKSNFIIHNKEEFLNNDFIFKVANSCNKIKKILTENENFNQENLFYYIVYLCRPILINSDYMGSNDKEISTDFNATLANTKNNMPADKLSTHLIKVANYCEENFDLFYYNLNKTNDFNSFSIQNATNKINEELNIIETSDLGKIETFKWQQDTVNKILNLNIQSPTFSVIVSETGTGKTRAIPKILTALNSEKVRYNLLLGLTTLTNQTYQEYQNLGLKKYINCLIGGELNKKDNNLFIKDGTFNDIDKDFNFEVKFNEKITFENNDKFYSGKEKSILQKPIIVATIDHFINHGSLSNGSSTNLFLRTISSDLVLDEIDNYTSNQLNMISRLIFLAGLYGKNVILSSATTSSIIVNSFFEIYKYGLKQYFELNNIENNFNYLCVSNYFKPTFIKNVNFSNENFVNDYEKFLLNHIENIENKISKHNLKILDISSSKCLEDAYSKIFNSCINLHTINNEEINNKKVSIGYIKFNLVENTIDFADYLSEVNLPEDTEIFIFCYHSKFILKDRERNEHYLNKLQRKHKKLYEIEHFSELINNSSKKNIMFLVSTSPVIEVGRDHDYDYAILDINSTEALIQGAGRVRRHRNYDYTNNNILLLSNPISKIMNNNIKQFTKTWIKNLKVLNNYDKKIFRNISFNFDNLNEEEVNLNNVENLLNKLLNDKKLSNKYCLLLNKNYNDNILKSVENITLDLQLNNNNFSFYNAQSKFIESNKTCLMSNNFMKYIKFRDGKNKIIRLVNDHFIDEEDQLELTNINVIQNYNKRFFINNFENKTKFKENVYYQMNLSDNDDGYNLKYSNIYGLIINKHLKL